MFIYIRIKITFRDDKTDQPTPPPPRDQDLSPLLLLSSIRPGPPYWS